MPPIVTLPPSVTQPPRDIGSGGVQKINSTDILDSTATGRAVLTAVDATTGRTALDAQQHSANLDGLSTKTAPAGAIVGTTDTQTLTNKTIQDAYLSGSPVAPTAAADSNTTQVANTAFVVGQAGAAAPSMDGTAAAGTSLKYARQDHVHPTDTSRAPLASPALTGTPTVPTATIDTNTTQAASTAFVLGQAGSATPPMDGVAAVGTSTRFARQDHKHPTDTSRAASGANSDITSLSGLTTALSIAQGGTGATTAAGATAALNAVVGDSGSGGTKGLVPAPAAGDAAAGKFLKADGTWTAPAGGGSGSGLAGYKSTTANTTATGSDLNKVWIALTNDHTITIPAASSVSAGGVYGPFKVISAITLTITRSSSGTFRLPAAIGSPTSFTLAQGQECYLVSDGNSVWEVLYLSDTAVISDATFSAASSLTITFPPSFRRFRLYGRFDLSASASLRLRTSINGGSTWATGSTDYAFDWLDKASSTTFNTGNTTDVSMALGSTLAAGFLTQYSEIDIFSPRDSATRTLVRSRSIGLQSASTNAPTGFMTIGGWRATSEDNNAIQIFPSSGTITGWYKIEGIR